MTFCILFFKLFHLSSTGAVSLDSWVPIHVPILDHCVCGVCVQFLSLPFQPHLVYFLPLENQTFLQEKLSPE